MFKRIVQQKEFLFFSGMVLMAIIGYQLAFKRTIEAWQLNHKLKDQLSASTNLSYQPDYQKRKNANLDKVIRRYQADTLILRSNSIAVVANVASKYNVRLSELPVQGESPNEESFMIQKITFEGDFYSLTKTLHELQSTKDIGIVSSATYLLNSGTDKKLSLDVYLTVIN